MLRVKFKRVGKRGQPGYRIVVGEKRTKLGGPPVEDLGSYDPFTKKAIINKERLSYWLGVGAQPTDTVHNLFVREGLIDAPKRAVHAKPKKKEGGEEAPATAPAGEGAPVAAPAEEASAPEAGKSSEVVATESTEASEPESAKPEKSAEEQKPEEA